MDVCDAAIQADAALNAPCQRAGFIKAKVVRCLFLQPLNNVGDAIAWRGNDGRRRRRYGLVRKVKMAHHGAGDVRDFKNQIHSTSGDCARRHAVERGLKGILRHHKTAALPHVHSARAAIRAGAGKNDTGDARGIFFCKRGEQKVKRQAHPMPDIRRGKMEDAILYRNVFTRRDHMNVAGAQALIVHRLGNPHCRMC